MPEVIISASGPQYGMVVNPDGSINTFVSGAVSTTSAANRSSVLSDIYAAASGATTNLSGNTIPSGYMLVVKASTTNIDYLSVGSRTTLLAQSGLALYPGDSIRVGVDNSNRISFVTRSNGDKVEVFSEL